MISEVADEGGGSVRPIDGGLVLMASMLLTAFAVGLREATAVCGFRQYLRRDTKLCRISVQQQLQDIRSATVGRPRVAGDELGHLVDMTYCS